MLAKIPRENERTFGRYKDLDSITSTFSRYRRKIAHRLANPRLLKITFHTLAPLESHHGIRKDKRHTSRDEDARPQKHSKHAGLHSSGQRIEGRRICMQGCVNTPEIQLLIEEGFEYVCKHNGLRFFRKRK